MPGCKHPILDGDHFHQPLEPRLHSRFRNDACPLPFPISWGIRHGTKINIDTDDNEKRQNSFKRAERRLEIIASRLTYGQSIETMRSHHFAPADHLSGEAIARNFVSCADRLLRRRNGPRLVQRTGGRTRRGWAGHKRGWEESRTWNGDPSLTALST